MKILVIGASGTIGAAILDRLGRDHDVIAAGRCTTPSIDLGNPESIRAMYEALPELDAVISAAGEAKFGSLEDLEDADFEFGLGNKLMGQVNLVRIGRDYVAEGGSFTLTSGVLSVRPGPQTALLSMVNAGLEGFGRAAALGLARGQRINVVSPPLVLETAQRMGWGDSGMPAAEVAASYEAAVLGSMTGETLFPHERVGSIAI